MKKIVKKYSGPILFVLLVSFISFTIEINELQAGEMSNYTDTVKVPPTRLLTILHPERLEEGFLAGFQALILKYIGLPSIPKPCGAAMLANQLLDNLCSEHQMDQSKHTCDETQIHK